MKILNSPKVRKSFHKLVSILAAVLIFCAVLLAIWFYFFYRNHEETNDAQVDQYVTPIMARVTGYIQKVRYEENQFVHKGDTLIIIDNREYKSHLDMAEADVENAVKTITVLEKNVAATNSGTSVKQSQLAAAKAEVLKTHQEYKRYVALLKEEAATEQQMERVKADYESAKARYQEILNAIQSIKLSTSEASAKIPTAQTVIQSKQAAVDNAALFLSYTVITAPYDGWVGKKMLQPGQMIKEGQTLLSVVSNEKWITANFKETQIQYLTIGQEVTITADAVNDKEFTGIIKSLSPASGARFSLLPPDNATGNFVKIEQRIPVRIELKKSDDKTDFLRAGMNVLVVAKHQ